MNQHSVSQPAGGRTSRRWTLGLPLLAILGLALLAVPRVVLHDLGVIQEGTPVNALLVFVPLLIWIAVVVAARVPRPFLTLLAVGACYGIFLALTHQLLWDVAVGDDPPQLGGNLANVDPAWQTVIIRSFAVVSGVFTGVMVGAVTGLLAWGLAAITRRR